MVIVKIRKVRDGIFIDGKNFISIVSRLCFVAGVYFKNESIKFSPLSKSNIKSIEYVALKTELGAKEVEDALQNNHPSWLEILGAYDLFDDEFDMSKVVAAKYTLSCDEFIAEEKKLKEYFESGKQYIIKKADGESVAVDVSDKIYSSSVENGVVTIVAATEDFDVEAFAKSMTKALEINVKDIKIERKQLFIDEGGELQDIDEYL